MALALAGCSKHDSHGGGGHAHQAPHGGTLLELGEHAYSLELVRDTAGGKLTVYVLDGHAENFIRVAAPAIQAVVLNDGARRALTLNAVANPVTGETVGNTSQFETQADWLKAGGELKGEINPVEIRGAKFGPIAFQLK